MNKARPTTLLYLSLLIALTYPQFSFAKDKNSDYLNQLPKAELEMMIYGAVDMAGHIAFLEDHDRGMCIWNWLADDVDAKKALIIRSMEKYPDHSPTGIIIALIERDCGKFPRAQENTIE